MGTVFDLIIARKIPADIVYEDDLCLCFRDIQPQAPTHLLMIPKQPIPSMVEVGSQHQALLGHLLVKCSQVAKEQGLDPGGYRLVVNSGADGGQSVFHLHIHILAGRRLSWPPG